MIFDRIEPHTLAPQVAAVAHLLPEHINVSRDVLPKIAAGSVENRCVKTNPRPLETAADIEALLKTAY